MFLPGDGHVCDTIIADNTDLRRKDLKVYIWSYHFSTLVVKNIEYTQTKHKLPQILPLTKIFKVLSLLQLWRLLTMKDQCTYS